MRSVLRFLKCVLVLTILVLTIDACSNRLPEPQKVPHRSSEFVQVPYPPPAGFVEVVPPRPNDRAVWLDGYWVWRGSFYVWKRGGWVMPPPGAKYAPWQAVYRTDGVLFFARGTWYDAKGNKLRAPEEIVSAYVPPNEITAEFQSPR